MAYRAARDEPTPPPEPWAQESPAHPAVDREEPSIPSPPPDRHAQLAAEVEARALQAIQTGLNAYATIPPLEQWPSMAFQAFVLLPLALVWNAFVAFVTSRRVHRFALRMSVLTSVYFVALFVAILAYIGFVSVWAPHAGSKKAVWLQYGQRETPYAHLHFVPGMALRHSHSFDSDEVLDGQKTFFLDDQAYDVTLDLVVPVTASNVDLGNFMITLKLFNANGSVVWRASRPSILLQEPAPVRALAGLARAMNEPSLSGLIQWLGGGDTSGSVSSSVAGLMWSIPTQVITVPLFRRKVLQPSHGPLGFLDPATIAHRDTGKERSEWTTPSSLRVTSGLLTVGRSDGYKFNGPQAVQINVQSTTSGLAGTSGRSRGELQTHSAVLRFDAHITGLRWMLYYHPILSFLTFTGLFMGLELSVALSLWALVSLYTSDTLKALTNPDPSVRSTSQGRTSTTRTGTSTETQMSGPSLSTETRPSGPHTPPLDDLSDGETVTESGGVTGTGQHTSSDLGSESHEESPETEPGLGSEPSSERDIVILPVQMTNNARSTSIQPHEWDQRPLPRGRTYSLGRVTETTEESTPVVSSDTNDGSTESSTLSGDDTDRD